MVVAGGGIGGLAVALALARRNFRVIVLEHEYSPIRHTDRIGCPVTVAWAEKESAEFARQSREFAEKLRAPTHIGNGMNHFEIIETLADARSPLAKTALEMIA